MPEDGAGRSGDRTLTSRSRLLALGAIILWGGLATLALELSALPPFLLTGIALVIGSLVGWRALRVRPPPAAALALGVYGLFGFHFFLFLALRSAPPVEANLVNYLWPLLIVVLAPAIVPGIRSSLRHGAAAIIGFLGAALLITAGAEVSGKAAHIGYLYALISAFIWATYSLMTRRFAHFPTAYVAWFCLVSGAAALACHFVFEPRYLPTGAQWPYLIAMGLGPMGIAFRLWDRALKQGDPREIGNLAYLTPLLSTLMLAIFADRPLGAGVLAAMAIIVFAAWLGSARPGSRPSPG